MINKQNEEAPRNFRFVAVILFITIFLAIYVLRLIDWQIVNGESFLRDAQKQDLNFLSLEGARGEILDKDGNVLVGNRTSYGIQFNANTMSKYDRNPTLVELLNILEERNEKWIDRLPILIDENGNYVFDENAEEEIKFLKSKAFLDLQEYATADDCMNALIRIYNVSGYSTKVKRDVLSLRYSMKKTDFSPDNPYLIADDISQETVGLLNQLHDKLPGVETKVITTRYYGEDSTLAPHIIGTFGSISDTMFKQMQKDGRAYDEEKNRTGYKVTDKVGLEGIEGAFEDELRGIGGIEQIINNDQGDVVDTVIIEAPKAGNTVQLTIDAKLQKAANESLKRNVDANQRNVPIANNGSAVAIDVKTGGVLAASNYPSFDLAQYYGDEDYYQEMAEDPREPFFNRAFAGVYAPGSVFKPMIAVAELEENIGLSTYVCDGGYSFYVSDKIGCLAHEGTTGNVVDLSTALKYSCNSFFCESGRLLGIDKMLAYADHFGLGTKTGVEIFEARGIMSNPKDYEQSHNGTKWTAGQNVYVAIGQLDNLFTPLQLATYCATIANDGLRYRSHLLDQITNYAGDEVVSKYEPKVLKEAEFNGWVMSMVKEGMYRAAHEHGGTAYDVFGDYPVKVGAKTGTAETNEKKSNITFIVFAPYHDPEIAVSVVLQYGNKGPYAMNVAKDILDAYFNEGAYKKNEESDSSAKTEMLASESSSETSEEPENGADMDVGAFYNPDKDLPSQKPDVSSSEQESSLMESSALESEQAESTDQQFESDE